jgi:type III pantothenate kinase
MILLAIDAGNTRIKWGLHDGLNWRAQGQLAHADVTHLPAALADWPTPTRIVVSHVAAATAYADLAQALVAFKLPLQRVFACARQCGVENGYADPTQLGADRWAALIAAQQLAGGTQLVVNAGTALTVDALHAGRFLGGLIVPGYRLLGAALQHATALPDVAAGQFSAWPDTTHDALESGRLRALAGAVTLQYQQLAQHADAQPGLVLSGGDATRLAPYLPQPLRQIDPLVLEGLRLIALDTTS